MKWTPKIFEGETMTKDEKEKAVSHLFAAVGKKIRELEEKSRHPIMKISRKMEDGKYVVRFVVFDASYNRWVHERSQLLARSMASAMVDGKVIVQYPKS